VARKHKLLDRIRRNPKNVSLRDFEALITDYGYIEEGGKTSKSYHRYIHYAV